MNEAISRALDPLLAGQDLSRAQTQDAFAVVMDGLATDAEIAALLTAFRIKGETVEEISGAAEAMAARATLIPCSHRDLLDTCGTGGDNLHTFNISTATALVAAACGVPVAKHGNRSVSSSSGSADVLEALGVNIQRTPEQTARCIEEVGIGFCFAQLVHGAMKHVAPVRKQLGFRTIFNLLGPLTNPANARYQLVGGNTPETAEKLAGALAELGRHRAVVVCGNGELDEVSLWGETSVWIVSDGQVQSERWTPDSFGLSDCTVDDLTVNSAAESADVIQRVFAAEPGPARDVILANTAAALYAADRITDLKEGVAIAAETLNNGKAADLIGRLVQATKD